MEKLNCYEILEISPAASQKAITQAYRRLARQFHPDLQPPERKGWAGEQMKRLNEAYTVLGDPEARARHDATVGLRFGAPSSRPRWTSSFSGEWFTGNPFSDEWFTGGPFSDEWFTGSSSHKAPRRIRSRKWRKLLTLADFVFWMLVMDFLVVGACLIAEWELVPSPELGARLAPEFEPQWIFAGIWFMVLVIALFKIIPPRR